jgi:hypothetical protein
LNSTIDVSPTGTGGTNQGPDFGGIAVKSSSLCSRKAAAALSRAAAAAISAVNSPSGTHLAGAPPHARFAHSLDAISAEDRDPPDSEDPVKNLTVEEPGGRTPDSEDPALMSDDDLMWMVAPADLEDLTWGDMTADDRRGHLIVTSTQEPLTTSEKVPGLVAGVTPPDEVQEPSEDVPSPPVSRTGTIIEGGITCEVAYDAERETTRAGGYPPLSRGEFSAAVARAGGEKKQLLLALCQRATEGGIKNPSQIALLVGDDVAKGTRPRPETPTGKSRGENPNSRSFDWNSVPAGPSVAPAAWQPPPTEEK